MSSNLSAINPLSYMGVRPTQPAPVTFQDGAPTSTDVKNFTISTIWIDRISEDAYMLLSNAGGVANWVRLGGTPGDITQITTPDSTVVTPTSGNVNFLNGTGINITGSGSSITVTNTGIAPLLQWNVTTASTATLVVNNGYFANSGGGVTYTLPATASVGDVIYISSINAGGWTIEQNAGQFIRIGNQVSTTGVTGTVASTAIGDGMLLVCAVTDTQFVCVGGSQGNITLS
jgi:hypothetical protein